MVELANCSRCNAVFAKGMRDVCQTCYHEEEAAYKIVYRFLSKQKNREATLNEIVDATGVKEELIVKFIKENRLRTTQFPNLGYPCEKCSEPIASGKLCSTCSKELLDELDKQEEIKQRQLEIKKRDRKKESIYYSINRGLKK